MKLTYNFILFFLIFLFSSAIDSRSSYFYGPDKPVIRAAPFSKLLVDRQKERSDLFQGDKISQVLNIRKDMIILDIGTGSGQYAYKFAEILNGTGEVYATDINPDMINYVKNEAAKRHLENLTPVLVKADGVDDFYSRHKYDLIFIAHALGYIPDCGHFLIKMKKYLGPQGHLFLLTDKFIGDFKPENFTDVNGLLKNIVEKGNDNPFDAYLRSLKPEAKIILAGGPISQRFLSQICRCFNLMLKDGHFFVPFLDRKDMKLRDDSSLSSQEKDYIDLNLSFLKESNLQDEKGGIDIKSPFINQMNFYVMENINRILILSEFKEFLFGGRSPYLPGGNVDGEIEGIKSDFKTYGYKLIQAYDFIPYQLLMEFSP